MEDGQGLLVIAIIFITFINWLSQTLKKKAAKKRGEPVEEPAEQSTAATKVAQHSTDQEISETTIPQRSGPEMDVRKFLAALSGTEPPQQPQPVPIITQGQEEQEHGKIEEVLTVTESADWEPEPAWLGDQSPDPDPDPDPGPGPGPGPGQILHHLKKTKKTHPIVLKLRSEGGAKEAIILSEILGKPKAFTD